MLEGDINAFIFGLALNKSCDTVSSVYIALHKTTKEMVAIKKYFIDDREPEDFDLIQQEIIKTRQLSHPNILPFLNTFVSGSDIYTTLPLMTYGSCSDLMDAHFRNGFPELAIAFIITEVLHAVNYIHKQGLIHRALKASHILIDEDGRINLCGLRYSCEVISNGKWHQTMYLLPPTSQNNLKWLSPELLRQDLRGYDEKSDIYSLGMTLYELAYGCVPFANIENTLMLTEKVQSNISSIIDETAFSSEFINIENNENGPNCDLAKNYQTKTKRELSDSFRHITELCLQNDPDKRPGSSELMLHSFFKQCKRSNVALIDILKPVKPLHELVIESLENQLTHLSDELDSMNLESNSWNFEGP